MSPVNHSSTTATRVDSISVVFPVRNQQSELNGRIESLIELLNQWADQFEILVIDDQSSDGTPQLLDKLQLRFPQIRSLRLGHGKGPRQSFAIALEHARGDIIFVTQTYKPIDQSYLAQMLELKSDPLMVYARGAIGKHAGSENLETPPSNGPSRTRTTRSQQVVDRLVNWGEEIDRTFRSNSPANHLHIFRRSAVELIRNGQIDLASLQITHARHDSITPPKRAIDSSKKGAAIEPSVTPSSSNANPLNTEPSRSLHKTDESFVAVDAAEIQFRPILNREFNGQLTRMQARSKESSDRPT